MQYAIYDIEIYDIEIIIRYCKSIAQKCNNQGDLIKKFILALLNR